MGWTSIQNTFKSNRDLYERELKGAWNHTCKVIDTSFVGNHIYELVQQEKENGEIEIFISLISISRYSQDQSINYKIESESCGPALKDCPLKFLKRSTCKAGYAEEWRKECFAYHENKKEHKKNIAQLKSSIKKGDIVEMINGVKVEIYNPNFSESKFTGYMTNGEDTNTLFSWKYKHLKQIAA